MPQLIKRKLVDDSGKQIKPETLYGFFALLTDKATGEKLNGGEVPLQGYLLGTSREAYDLAKKQQTSLEGQYPHARVSVAHHAMELVGPLMKTQTVEMRLAFQHEQMVSGYLAQVIAEKEAEQSLAINPDLTMEVRVDTVLKNAHGFVNDQVRMFEEQKAAQKSGLHGPDGKPVAVEHAPEPEVVNELSDEDEAIQAELNREMREEAGLGKVLAFPGSNSIKTEDGAEGSVDTVDVQVEEPVLA